MLNRAPAASSTLRGAASPPNSRSIASSRRRAARERFGQHDGRLCHLPVKLNSLTIEASPPGAPSFAGAPSEAAGDKKRPRLRGVVGRLLVWRSVFSLLSGYRAVSDEAPDLVGSALFFGVPAGVVSSSRRTPLLVRYEQHACQPSRAAARCDMLSTAARVTVMQRTLPACPRRRASADGALRDLCIPCIGGRDVKISDAMRWNSVTEREGICHTSP